MNQKSLLLILICFFSLFGVWAQEINPNGFNVLYYPNGVKSSEGVLRDGKPDGYWKTYNEEGVLVMEGSRKDFLLDSLWKFYDNDGRLVLEVSYKEGKKDGLRKTYLDKEYVLDYFRQDTQTQISYTYLNNGKIVRETPYEDGLAEGFSKEYDTTGQIIVVTQYIKGVLIKREAINRYSYDGLKQGVWKAFNPNGTLSWEGFYRNGKKSGFFKYYDENGNFLKVEKYENDVLLENAVETRQIERRTAYYPTGQTKTIAGYFQDLPEGVRLEYDINGNITEGYIFRNGVLINEGIVDGGGRRQGAWKEYYESGALRWEGAYLNSLMQGRWKYYFEDGALEMVGSYSKTGKRIGPWIWFYPNGDTLLHENYIAGLRDGESVEYDTRGNCIRKGAFLEGAEDGPWYYNDNGVVTEGNFNQGERDGVWKSYYADGKLLSEENYKDGVLDGKFTHYYPSGKVKLTGKYQMGVRTGIWYSYAENGELILAVEYYRGVEMKWDLFKLDPLPEAEE